MGTIFCLFVYIFPLQKYLKYLGKNLPIREKSNLECFVLREGTYAHLKYEFKFCSMLCFK